MINWFRREFWRLVPVVLFFFVAFSLVDLTAFLMHRPEVIYYNFIVIAVAAGVMGKVVLISDHLLFVDLFSHKPLIYSTLWKTFIYTMASLLVRVLDRAIPRLIAGEGWEEAFQAIHTQTEHLPFWISQIWLAVLFVVFVAYRELICAVGTDKVRKLFFGG